MRIITARRRSVVFAGVLAVLTGGVAGPVSAGAEPPLPGACPQIMSVDDVNEGDVGNGWTVERGQERERFRFEVLGILEDGIAPGLDLIVVELKDVAGNDMLERAGGIWAGMSGSPVYINGRLLGATAYGFTLSPSPIAGVTPAEDMARLRELSPTATASVDVPAGMRGDLARRAGVSESEASSFERLPVPVAVSGLNKRARDRFQEALDDRGINGIVTAGSSRVRPTGGSSFVAPQPGGNFAGVISYGDLTAAGVGTTTYVCGDQALAFGHPFTFTGRAGFGANDANAITVVRDDTLGAFKLASIAGLFGKLDQDRLAAVRAALGETPAMRPVTSRVTDLDTGRSRNGRTDVTMSEWVPDISAFHLLFNYDRVFDQIGQGSSWVKWTVTGKRANGTTWTLERANRYASRFDISFESIFELYDQLARIHYNEFQRVTIDSVHLQSKVQKAYRAYSIEGVLISRNGGPFRERQQLRVSPGDDLVIRASLRQFRGGLTSVDIPLSVPNDASGEGFLAVFGQAGEFPEPAPAGSFNGLLNALENAPKNNDVIADLVLFGESGESSTTASRRLDRVVSGFFEVYVTVQ